MNFIPRALARGVVSLISTMIIIRITMLTLMSLNHLFGLSTFFLVNRFSLSIANLCIRLKRWLDSSINEEYEMNV